MARWQRARDLLTVPPGSRVLDLGCAFGFGTRLLERRYRTYGHDLSEAYIERARRRSARSVFTCGPADEIPYPDGYFDAVLLLDVLEHVPDVSGVIEEVDRVLRPHGELIVSVPNRGLLWRLDSLNLYGALLGPRAPAPTDDPSWQLKPHHEHFTAAELRRLFESHFQMQFVAYSGLGLAEPVNLGLLLLFRAALRAPRLYAVFQYLYFGVYLAEDRLRTGDFGYHLMMKLRKR